MHLFLIIVIICLPIDASNNRNAFTNDTSFGHGTVTVHNVTHMQWEVRKNYNNNMTD